MKRAALYIRVSTEEQAMHGYSLEAQRDALTKYAKEHDLFIVDYYMDEGKSARKKYTSRPEFMRMLRDVAEPPVELGKDDQINLACPYVLQQPLQFGALRGFLPGADTFIDILIDNKYVVLSCPLPQVFTLGFNGKPVYGLLLCGDSDI